MRSVFGSIATILLWFQFSISATAQEYKEWSATFTTNEGLLVGNVWDAQDDKKGRMWFATQNGVSCFDGIKYKNYLNSAADSLLHKNWGCHFLTIDGSGRIWVATTFALFYFDETADQFVAYDLSSIEPNAQKDSWENEIYLQDIGENGAILFRKFEGLYEIEPKSLQIKKIMNLPKKWRSVNGILGRDKDGLIWSGGWHQSEIALFRTDGSIERIITSPSVETWEIFQDPKENLVWVGTSGLCSYEKSTSRWQRWSQLNLHAQCFSLARRLSSDRIIWFVSPGNNTCLNFDRYYRKIMPDRYTNINGPGDLRCGVLNKMFVDTKSNVWLAGRHGVSAIFCDQSEYKKWTTCKNKPASDLILSNQQELSGDIWALPRNLQSLWFSDGDRRAYIAFSDMEKAFFDGKLRKDGMIEGERESYNFETGKKVKEPVIYQKNKFGTWIEIDAQTGNVSGEVKLLGSDDKKIYMPKGKYFHPDSDHSGTWLTSDGIILYVFQSDDNIVLILVNHLLICNKKGPTGWNGVQIRNYGECRTEMAVYLTFPMKDKMDWNWVDLDGFCDLNKGSQGGGFANRLAAAAASDSVYITSFRVFDEDQPFLLSEISQVPLVLKHDQNFITFDIATSANPNVPLKFKYKLEGFNTDWSGSTADKSISYTNLGAGSYTFRVIATDIEGTELRGQATFLLKILPPYYQTWWFISLCVLLLAGAIIMLFRYQLRQRLKEELLRQSIARDLHDDLGSTLSTISILSELAVRSNLEDKERLRLNSIGEKARSAIDSIGDIVWAVNPENDTMESVIARMRAFAGEVLENKEIAFHFDVGEGVAALPLMMEKRRDIYLIFKEAINNCVKHSAAKKVDIILAINAGVLSVLIQDNGNGYDPVAFDKRNLGGNGLRNMQTRAAGMGGTLDITSKPGLGSKLTLKIPVS